MRPVRVVAALALAGLVLAAPPLYPQEEPLQAGSEGVRIPKRTRTVRPEYPAEAQAQGIRGIVILELVIDTQGRVASASVVRSVPGLDEAALAAVRQWEYEVTRVNGKPVSVKLTVPITFAMKLPEMTRQEGIPELRQGASLAWPEGAGGGALVTAEVTLDADGRIALARVTQGDMPWSGALIQALRTWRFARPDEDLTISFRVEAEFVPDKGKQARHVELRLGGLRRSESFASAPTPVTTPAAPPAARAEPEPAEPARPAEPAASASPGGTGPAPTASEPAAGEAPGSGAGAPPAPVAAPSAQPSASTEPVAPPGSGAAGAPAAPQAPPTAAEAVPAATAPPTEVITAPPPPEPLESGISAIRDVSLEPGVPDLTRGRRPVAPPLARMAGASGTVEVAFSVGAAGLTSVREVKGPELLRAAAEQAVASWVFRRTRTQRLYLLATLTYEGDKASATVRPQQP